MSRTGAGSSARLRKNADAEAPRVTRRLSPEDRERQIVAKAIEHFTLHGFSGGTRELAKQIGVTQPLLYRYFPSKEALIDRVYGEVFRWSASWVPDLTDRHVPLRERMYRFYAEYSSVILREQWIRIFIFAGLTREGINTKYLNRMRTQVFLPLLDEIRAEYGIAAPRSAQELDTEIELLRGLHASIFYLGVRKWIFGTPIPQDVEGLIRRMVDVFLQGTPAVMRAMRKLPDAQAAPSKKRAVG